MGKLIVLKNVKDNNTFLRAKFRFSSILFVNESRINCFFQVKAFDSGLKLLERAADALFSVIKRIALCRSHCVAFYLPRLSNKGTL